MSTKDINEMSLYVSPQIKDILANTESVDRKEFLARSEPCDIVTLFTPKRAFGDNPERSKYGTYFMSSFQGSPYTTSKIILSKDTIAGYGLSWLVKGKGAPNDFLAYSWPKYINELYEACLIRVPNLTPTQKGKIIMYVKKNLNRPYDGVGLLRTAWNRFVKNKVKTLFAKGGQTGDVSEKDLESVREGLICSNIIAIAYRMAGVDVSFSNSMYDTWPKDFILSPDTIKVCKLDLSW